MAFFGSLTMQKLKILAIRSTIVHNESSFLTIIVIETKKWTILFIFLLEREIFEVTVQGIHQSSKKLLLSVRYSFVKMTWKLF